MVHNSLFLLAVKRAMRSPSSNGNTFASTSFKDTFEEVSIYNTQMGEFIDDMIQECMSSISPKLKKYKNEIRDSLLEAKEFETYIEDVDTGTFCNTMYDNNVGDLRVFVYAFIPETSEMTKCETFDLRANFRLQDTIITFTQTKKKLFGGTKTWKEQQRIPAGVTAQDFVACLSILLGPFMYSNDKDTSGIRKTLAEHASTIPNTMPSDDARRTVYNPMTKMNVVVTDPEVLKLIPTKWVYVTSQQVEAATNDLFWEFDE